MTVREVPLSEPGQRPLRRIEQLRRHPGDVRITLVRCRGAVLVGRRARSRASGPTRCRRRRLTLLDAGSPPAHLSGAAGWLSRWRVIRRRRPARRRSSKRRPVALPACHDRVDDRPLFLDLVGREGVASPSIGSRSALVCPAGQAVGRRCCRGSPCAPSDRHSLPRHLRPDREGEALVGLHVDQKHVRRSPAASSKGGGGELDRNRRLATRPSPSEHRTACRPSASCRRRASRRRTSGLRVRRHALLSR